jgi:hypothetical protein
MVVRDGGAMVIRWEQKWRASVRARRCAFGKVNQRALIIGGMPEDIRATQTS